MDPEITISSKVEKPDDLTKEKEDIDGLVDEFHNGQFENDFDLERFPVREFTYQAPFFKEIIAFNPVVSILGAAILWGVAVWSIGQ